MFDLSAWLSGLVVLLGAAFLTWLVSVAKRNVAIVDSLWSLMFLLAALAYAWVAPAWDEAGAAHVAAPGTVERRELVLALVAVWALRLAIYITARNWGHPEDYRYQAIRRRNDPGFTFKSLYLVFGLQALLAWVISLPLLGAILGIRPLGAARLRRRGAVAGRAGVRGRRRLAARAVQDATPPTRARSWIAACGATRATRTTSATSASGGAST